MVCRDQMVLSSVYCTLLFKLCLANICQQKANTTQQLDILSSCCVPHNNHNPLCVQSKELQLDIIPATAPGSEVKLRDAAHELNEEKRKSARRKE